MELSPPFSVPLTILYCWLHDRLSSIVRPKYFVFLTFSLIDLIKLRKLSCLCIQNSIYLGTKRRVCDVGYTLIV